MWHLFDQELEEHLHYYISLNLDLCLKGFIAKIVWTYHNFKYL